MGNALERAAREMQDELAPYSIRVSSNELPRRIIWEGLELQVQYGTTKAECKKKLRQVIRLAEQAKFVKSQERLL